MSGFILQLPHIEPSTEPAVSKHLELQGKLCPTLKTELKNQSLRLKENLLALVADRRVSGSITPI